MDKIISQNSLNYKGKVDLYFLKKGKEIHLATLNEGLAGISDLFTRAVLGYPTDNYRPYYVDLFNEDGESMLFSPAEVRASSYGIISGETGDDAYMNGWKYPVFDALIMTENMVDIKDGIAYLVVMSKNYTKLARVAINIDYEALDNPDPDLPILKLRAGNNILVRWSMYLSNRLKEDE